MSTAADEKSFFQSSKESSTEMTDLGSNSEQAKKKPKYYEGVYMNDRTISTNGDVTPALLRSPISRGLFHLPRYVPKYTINSRLHANYTDETFSDSKSSRTFDRKYKDPDDDSYFREVPIYRDRADGGVETTSSSSETKKTKKKKSKGRTKSKEENAESEQRKACCSKCCCAVECCTPKCRRCACILAVVALVVAAALLAVALGLYFGYFLQFGDSYPMKANFTVTNATFPAYLSNLSNPNTMNLTNSVCHAFERTLENVSQIVVRLSSCSAISYTSGSINAIFNLDVSHRRAEFTNSGDAFTNAIIDRVKTEFQPNHASGYFAAAFSNSVLSSGDKSGGIYFNVVLNEISSGHFSSPNTPSTSTVRPAIISSIVVKTTKPSPTSTAKVSRIANTASSTSTDNSSTTTITPLNSTANQSSIPLTVPPTSSSTQSHTVPPTSSSTQSPAVPPSSSSTQSPAVPPTSSSTQSPAVPPTNSSTQSPTIPPTSTRYRTTTIPAVPAFTSTRHLDITTAVPSSLASTSGPSTKQVMTSSERKLIHSTSAATNRSATAATSSR